MADPVRKVGVLGVGFGTDVHVPAFRSEGWDVAAIWSRREERAREAASTLEIADAYTDFEALLARDDLDAVAVVSPPVTHHAMTLAALRAGKHVLCEKPFAGNVVEAREMQAAAEASGRTAMIAHEFRWAPQRAYIKELIDDGYVGDLRLATISLLFPFPPGRMETGWFSQTSMGGGVLGALGVHFMDALRFWFGDVASVSGRLARYAATRGALEDGGEGVLDSDDSFTATLTFKSGGMATVLVSAAVSPNQGGQIVIAGSDGVLRATQPGPNPMADGVVLGGKAGDKAMVELPMPAKYLPFADDRDPRLMPFRRLVQRFTEGIETGTSPAPNFEDGVRGQEILDALRASSANGVTVTLD